jgi:hypothetical protein
MYAFFLNFFFTFALARAFPGAAHLPFLFSLLPLVGAVDGPASTSADAGSQLAALLGPLAAAWNLNLSGSGIFPWQHTYSQKCSTAEFFFFSTPPNTIGGLLTQCRSALQANISEVTVTFRKVPGLDLTWHAFWAAESDFNPEDFDPAAFLEYVRTHPTAVPQHTLDKDTTQSTIVFPLIPVIGLSSAVYTSLPPLRAPTIVVFVSASSGSLRDKDFVFTISGNVHISGYGYVAGSVPERPAAPEPISFSTN